MSRGAWQAIRDQLSDEIASGVLTPGGAIADGAGVLLHV